MTPEEEKIWLRLPLPSEWPSDRIAVPVLSEIPPWELVWPPPSAQVVFRKKYVNGICVGWELDYNATRGIDSDTDLRTI